MYREKVGNEKGIHQPAPGGGSLPPIRGAVRSIEGSRTHLMTILCIPVARRAGPRAECCTDAHTQMALAQKSVPSEQTKGGKRIRGPQRGSVMRPSGWMIFQSNGADTGAVMPLPASLL